MRADLFACWPLFAAVCCMLLVVSCSVLFAVCCLLLVVGCLSVDCMSLCIVRCLLCVVCVLIVVVCSLLFGVRCVLPAGC